MPYIGTPPPSVPFLAAPAQSFSGNGSTTTFTLSRSVGALTDIEVLVNNVQQSPYDASYNVVGGTSLVFSEAPSAGTNNIYVIYRGLAIGTAIDTGAYRKAEVDALVAGKQNALGYTPVNKAGDTMTGALTVRSTSSKTATGSYGLALQDTSNNNHQLWMGYDPTSNEGFIQATTVGTAHRNLVLNPNGGFLLTPSQPVVVVSGNQAAYTSTGVVPANLVLTGTTSGIAAYNTSTYRFTAPVAGHYEVGGHGLWTTAGINEVAVRVNGATRNKHYSQSDRTVTLSSIVYLASGDYIDITSSSQGLYLDSYSNSYTWFTYRLVG